MTTLRILGPVEVWRADERIALGGPRQVALFSFLVLKANQAVSRDALTDAIWGPARADGDNRLSMAITRLRRALDRLRAETAPRLQTVSGGYLLSVGPGQLDADVFHARVHAGAAALESGSPAEAAELFEQALTLWRGPPLAEVAFEDFAQGEIRRLQELRLHALECRIDAELALGRHAAVVGQLQGLVAEEPTREHLARQLMLALYGVGRQADALEVYQQVRASLADELGLEPGPALKALQLEILEQADSLGTRPDHRKVDSTTMPSWRRRASMPVRLRAHGPPVFADRVPEREALTRALGSMPSGGRQAAFVTGEAGIGKSRLVSEFAHEAQAAGALVLAGRCDEGLSLPYQPFVEALEHLVHHAPPELLDRHISEYGDSIARLVPALHAASDQAEASESGRYVLFRAIEGLLGEVAQEGPVLVVVEDLHWADLPTLKLLRRLLTSPRSLALMLVCTCRVNGTGEQDELKGLLADAHREPGIQRLELSGLEDVDVAELVGGMNETPAGDPDDRLAAELRATTEGNPFFVTELVRSLVASEDLTADGGTLQLGHGVDPAERLPVSIRETLARRAGNRGDSVRRCLEVAAVIGEEFELDLVADVVGDEVASAAMQLAIQDALIVELPGRRPQFRFTHTLMRRYLYGELGRLRQTELHRQIASAMEPGMETGGRVVAALAQQWVQAGDADTHRALRYSILAGDDALQKLAPDEARRWYDGSLELLRQDQQATAARRSQLLIKRGEAERQAGDQRFRLTLLEAAEIAQQTGEHDMLVRAALANTRGMQSETGVVDRGRLAVLDAALDVVGEGDGPERARLLATKGAELMYSGEWQARVRLSDEALAIARRLDDPDALITVLNLRFVTLLAPETLAEREANTEEAVTIAERQRDPLVRFYAYHWRAYACIEAGDGLAARSWMTREQDIADRFRQPTTLWLNRADQANLAIIAGQLTRAAGLAMEALELGQHSEPDALACFAAQQAAISFEHGGLGELVPMLEQAVSENPGVPGFRATLALALIQASRLQEARELIDQAVDAEFAHLPYDVTWLTVSCIYALAASALEHVPGARVLYRMLEPWSDQVAFPAFGVWGPVSLHLGSLSITIGELDIAERHLRAAARAAMRAGAPRWEAHANRRLAHLSEMSR